MKTLLNISILTWFLLLCHSLLVQGFNTCPNPQSIVGKVQKILTSRPPTSVYPSSGLTSSLYSIRSLVEDIESSAIKNGGKLLFVGGKGGVGKTTTSSALAVELASNCYADLNVLIVSTDPAHSLGDALDVELSGEPVQLTDPLTGGRLFAVEVDPASALDDFRSMIDAFDVTQLADALGVSPSMLEDFGLGDFSSLLNNPPPGLDELVALSNVLDSASSATGKYDVVVVDTAPTGHTLRLLALPAFLDGFLGKLIELRVKLSGFASTLQAFFGSSEASKRAQTIDDALAKLEAFRKRMTGLRSMLSDSNKTNFLIVTIPTTLGVAESKRLMAELSSQDISVSDIVVNQYIGLISSSSSNEDQPLVQYYERRKNGQQKSLVYLRNAVADVSSSPEFKQNGDGTPIAITQTPFFDVELVGAPALSYLGTTCYLNNPSFSHLMNDDGKLIYIRCECFHFLSASSISFTFIQVASDVKVVICGGKGGVGM